MMHDKDGDRDTYSWDRHAKRLFALGYLADESFARAICTVLTQHGKIIVTNELLEDAKDDLITRIIGPPPTDTQKKEVHDTNMAEMRTVLERNA